MLSHLLHDSFFFLIIRASFYIAWILVCGIFELVLYSITFYKIVKVTLPNIRPGPSWQEPLAQSGQPILITDHKRRQIEAASLFTWVDKTAVRTEKTLKVGPWWYFWWQHIGFRIKRSRVRFPLGGGLFLFSFLALNQWCTHNQVPRVAHTTRFQLSRKNGC